MAQVLATPGVYIEEKPAFPNSVVAVATAVPAFIGYTAKASRNNKSLIDVPTRITSFNEYLQYFGDGPKVKFKVEEDANEGFKVSLDPDAKSKFNLYNSMRIFFANGGSNCYIVSVGVYKDKDGKQVPLDLNVKDFTGENPDRLGGGIMTLLKEPEPTMLVIPDAVLLEEEACQTLHQQMLKHCGSDMKSRVALLDVYDGDKVRMRGTPEDVIDNFRTGVNNEFLKWGAGYYPWLNTTIVGTDEVNYTNISAAADLQTLLKAAVEKSKTDEEIDEERANKINEEIDKVGDDLDEGLHDTLLVISPLYKAIMGEIRNQLNVIPPSGAMAGVISMVDNNVGVFKSPANVSIGSVVKPSVNITHTEQEDLNLPLNGKAVNAIRSFPGKGVLVWGARTLDGNSQDWRYLSVRRTIIMIEQSLKTACEAYVFEPNVVNTWVTVKGMITNFLTDQWKQGALAGAVPEDAFSVDVGLGATMTPTDILDGRMNITVKLAVVRPAEFIVITIQQQMQKS
ncbi:MAG: phage tail sheath C-terminal domain-containing protein [Bacteroidota bacterium]